MKILILLIALLACLFDDTSFASPSATATWVATTTAINSSRSAAQDDEDDVLSSSDDLEARIKAAIEDYDW